MVTYSREIDIKAPIEKVFHFHDNTDNLLKISPPDAGVSILEASEPGLGQKVVLSIKQLGIITLEWEVEITEYDPPHRMTDEQKRGPFGSWKQSREFQAIDQQTTRLIDKIEYTLPLHALAQLLVGGLVRKKITDMFEYRQKTLKEILENNR
jgi:ligand-binding SRPBCC domain-containing protein